MPGVTIVSDVIGEYKTPIVSRTFNDRYLIDVDLDGHLIMAKLKTLELVCLIDDCYIEVRRFPNGTSGTVLAETHDGQELTIDLTMILYWMQSNDNKRRNYIQGLSVPID